MGVSGAGKTTLLDVLAQRTTMGVITGDMLVNGRAQDDSFQRKTGYVQQQDLHLETATVRESLRFSAMLRQPKTVSNEEKYKYVEDVIDMLNMREFANAIVGVPGQGLNVEQRKLLTIGVELAAKPKLLLFLDEPTSGLDSQSSWAICAFLRKLADAGQAILCTIHQVSVPAIDSCCQTNHCLYSHPPCYFSNLTVFCS
jgi:ABC-type multidrug transport system ATPase subunit